MKKDIKNNNVYTINLNDDLKNIIAKLADHYNRRPADLLRLIITPALIDAYAVMQQQLYKSNNDPWKVATFKKSEE